ncbi:putative LuxR family transcriptional regulator [Gordonia hirsuta DSM 44140 = NBRC 16056]|uniref:Putative LuxR family transcriptional regulator n=1 Tax=Gordonia hirsuta DSM 44140 = NBRC 16056 TaxID=1121927 RepID=L7LFF3_9ACTN|nr:LuxR C-terminal-related transcriptional regulator [Gordonia hirsuta]GAC58812.1 putative LuxR family transcriptional regulator [Gordonia hirsuta DSM 44140 = NBRC 16056]
MPKNKIVGVVAEHDLADAALCALVHRVGYHATLIDLEQPQPALMTSVHAVVLRSRARLAQVGADPRLAGARAALVESAGMTPLQLDPKAPITVIPTGNEAEQQLVHFLEAAVGIPRRPGAVPVSRREREVLRTYALGATVEETAVEHYLATSTVRTHYRRVTARYTRAGRTVTNKAQLLLQMVADGWIRLPEVAPESIEGSDSDVA